MSLFYMFLYMDLSTAPIGGLWAGMGVILSLMSFLCIPNQLQNPQDKDVVKNH